MIQILKTVVIMFLSVEMAFSGMINGISVKKDYDMPDVETGEYTQYVDSFIGNIGIVEQNFTAGGNLHQV